MRVAGIPFVQGRNAVTDRDGVKYGIAIHATDNTAAATSEASFATRRTDGVGSHFYADATQVIQSIDTRDRTGHAGSGIGNENAIAVEITGLTTWTRQQWLDRVNWPLLGRVVQQVCAFHGIPAVRRGVAEMQTNPKVRGLYGHDDMRRAWGGTDHTDPGGNFPWDRLLSAVAGAPEGAATTTGDDDLDAGQAQRLTNTDQTLYALGQLDDKALGVSIGGRGEQPLPLVALLKRLDAATAADATRDAATVAAVQALTTGGGTPDAAPIIAAIREEADKTRDLVTSLQEELAGVRAENERLLARLAAALQS